MVWNRRASKKGGKRNPPSEWVWSPRPTHEPLVTKETLRPPAAGGQRSQGSRTGAGLNTHPQTKRTYRLRSYVGCDLCDRRMFGKTRHAIAYLACEPERQHHKGRTDWYSDHPKSLWVREEILLDAVRSFFAQRIFGPDRRRYLRTQLQRSAKDQNNDTRAERRKRLLTRELAGLQRRQDNLIDQLENFEATGDTAADREYRQSIQRRFAELTAARHTKQSELDQINVDAPQAGDDADLLDQIPQLQADLTELPDGLERKLYDAFHLKVRYNRTRHEATIQVTIREDTITTLTKATQTSQGTGEGGSAEHNHLFPCSGRPLQDSNLRTRLRRPVLYPLS